MYHKRRNRCAGVESWHPDEYTEAEYPAPMNASEVHQWRQRQKHISPWQVLKCQALAGIAGGVAVCLLLQNSAAIISWFYGVLAVLLPAMFFARRMGRSPSLGLLVIGQMIKLVESVVLIALAPWVLAELSWAMLFLAITLTVNMYWIAPIWLARSRNV